MKRADEGDRRCQPEKTTNGEPDPKRIREICGYLAEPTEHIRSLDEPGEGFHLSPHDLRRTSKGTVGDSPRQHAAE